MRGWAGAIHASRGLILGPRHQSLDIGPRRGLVAPTETRSLRGSMRPLTTCLAVLHRHGRSCSGATEGREATRMPAWGHAGGLDCGVLGASEGLLAGPAKYPLPAVCVRRAAAGAVPSDLRAPFVSPRISRLVASSQRPTSARPPLRRRRPSLTCTAPCTSSSCGIIARPATASPPCRLRPEPATRSCPFLCCPRPRCRRQEAHDGFFSVCSSPEICFHAPSSQPWPSWPCPSFPSRQGPSHYRLRSVNSPLTKPHPTGP